LEERLTEQVAAMTRASLRRVINATGVIIHTNLGRAPLAKEAAAAISELACHYSNLEFDIESGERGHRESHCQELLARLAGSEAAVVANNNAAAVLLVLNSLAEGGEVIVSRGELIEIGGSFRIPDVMEKSGAILREVGTTNRTRLSDYRRAINEGTRLILRVHPSNYRIIGFTERPSVEEIANLARETGIPSYEDLGSGCLIDLAPYGVTDEPVVAASLKAGISIVSFSGDKMLGGPQAGVIAGSTELVQKVKKNPLMRALRVDKLTYTALEATLRFYDRGSASRDVPAIRAIAATRDEIGVRADRLCERLRGMATEMESLLEDGVSVVGGGAAPGVRLPTVLIAIEHPRLSAAILSERLRGYRVPVITRTERNRILIDLRTVDETEEELLVAAISSVAEADQTAASAEA
jgi:L-seryl-tRNA(Ser) seleniumtransferase